MAPRPSYQRISQRFGPLAMICPWFIGIRASDGFSTIEERAAIPISELSASGRIEFRRVGALGSSIRLDLITLELHAPLTFSGTIGTQETPFEVVATVDVLHEPATVVPLGTAERSPFVRLFGERQVTVDGIFTTLAGATNFNQTFSIPPGRDSKARTQGLSFIRVFESGESGPVSYMPIYEAGGIQWDLGIGLGRLELKYVPEPSATLLLGLMGVGWLALRVRGSSDPSLSR